MVAETANGCLVLHSRKNDRREAQPRAEELEKTFLRALLLGVSGELLPS